MTRFSVDTTCVVAAVCGWHEKHAVAAAEIERRLNAGDKLVTPAPVLLEAYAVLTRLPAPHRLSPADAWKLLETNFVEGCTVFAIDAEAHVNLLRRLADSATSGGRTYDAVMAECAARAHAAELLTFQQRHFHPAPAGLNIVELP